MRILVVQDDPKSHDAVYQAFQFCLPEAELIYTSSGIEGVQLCRSSRLDLIIIDLDVADMNGFGVLREIHQHTRVPVMVLSSSGEEPETVRCLEMGADEYIVKPFRQLEFISRARVLLRRNKFSNKLNPAFETDRGG
jgi:DNA-binding response OmpR family regulator